MKKVLLFWAILLLLSGCATRTSIMKSWEGTHINDLTASWGVPSSILSRQSGGKTYTWVSVYGNAYGVNQCRETFVTNSSGYIVSWSYSNCSEW